MLLTSLSLQFLGYDENTFHRVRRSLKNRNSKKKRAVTYETVFAPPTRPTKVQKEHPWKKLWKGLDLVYL
jgi:transposase